VDNRTEFFRSLVAARLSQFVSAKFRILCIVQAVVATVTGTTTTKFALQDLIPAPSDKTKPSHNEAQETRSLFKKQMNF